MFICILVNKDTRKGDDTLFRQNNGKIKFHHSIKCFLSNNTTYKFVLLLLCSRKSQDCLTIAGLLEYTTAHWRTVVQCSSIWRWQPTCAARFSLQPCPSCEIVNGILQHYVPVREQWEAPQKQPAYISLPTHAEPGNYSQWRQTSPSLYSSLSLREREWQISIDRQTDR